MSKKINSTPEPSHSVGTPEPAEASVIRDKTGGHTIAIYDAKGRKIKVFNVHAKRSPGPSGRILRTGHEVANIDKLQTRCLSFDPWPGPYPPTPASRVATPTEETLSPSKPLKR